MDVSDFGHGSRSIKTSSNLGHTSHHDLHGNCVASNEEEKNVTSPTETLFQIFQNEVAIASLGDRQHNDLRCISATDRETGCVGGMALGQKNGQDWLRDIVCFGIDS